MKIFLGVMTVALAALAADQPGYTHYSDKQLADKAQELHGKVKGGLASEVLGKWENHAVQAAHREASGQSEYHENQSDILMIRKGSATLVLGGKVVGGKTTAPGEIRGESIEGGEAREVKPGDVIHIAPKTPHQMILKAGQTIDYVAVKVDVK